MAKRRLVKRVKTRIPEYTHLGCPLTKSQSLWCHALCTPKEGVGMCGRVAPHALIGATGEAILKFKLDKAHQESEVQVA